MVSLLKSDFYKLFRMKSFYICAAIAAVLSGLAIVFLNSLLNNSIGISADLLGYDGVYALTSGLGQAGLFITIFISLFIPNEFSFGTIKNMISAGVSKWEIYVSKVIMGIFVVVSYLLLCGLTSFAVGSIMWGTGEVTRNMYLDIFRMIALVAFAEFALQSLFILIGFLIRRSGGTVAVNLVISVLFVSTVLKLTDFLVQNYLKVEDFLSSKYWPSTYTTKFMALEIDSKDIVTGSIVCGAFILVCAGIGLLSFYKRDVK